MHVLESWSDVRRTSRRDCQSLSLILFKVFYRAVLENSLSFKFWLRKKVQSSTYFCKSLKFTSPLWQHFKIFRVWDDVKSDQVFVWCSSFLKNFKVFLQPKVEVDENFLQLYTSREFWILLSLFAGLNWIEHYVLVPLKENFPIRFWHKPKILKEKH